MGLSGPPPYRDPRLLVLIILGGSLGTAVRAWLESSFAAPAGTWPWVTFLINIAGSFLLGLLLEGLARTGADAGWRRRVRVGAGTGMLGGFTTYSTFGVETALLLDGGQLVTGVGYGLASVAVGLVAAWAGVEAARGLTGRVRTATPPPATAR